MSTRTFTLAVTAVATFAMPALMPASASAFGLRTVAPARIVVSHPGRSVGWRTGLGWGYGRGWCYWHPYACYRY